MCRLTLIPKSPRRNDRTPFAVQLLANLGHGILNIGYQFRKFDQTVAVSVAVMESVDQSPREYAATLITLKCRFTRCRGGALSR